MFKGRLVRGHFYTLPSYKNEYLLQFKGMKGKLYIFDRIAAENTEGINTGNPPIKLAAHGKFHKKLKEVDSDDLPLYVGWGYHTENFTKLITRPKNLRVKLQRKRLNKRMLHSKN